MLEGEKTVLMRSDKSWHYVVDMNVRDRDQAHCAMLDLNIAIEKRPGIVIYISNKTIEDIEKAEAKGEIKPEPKVKAVSKPKAKANPKK